MTSKISTIAWVLEEGVEATNNSGKLRLKKFKFDDISDDEVLVEPIFGCWEGNMAHALQRQPIDICKVRNENQVVLGNSGVVRVLKVGKKTKRIREGDYCVVFCNGVRDSHGYTLKVFAYDAPQTIGLLAKRTKLNMQQLIPLPEGIISIGKLKSWAGFSLRYITAWSNWKIAYSAFRLQNSSKQSPLPFIWGWGGGVAFAELSLAKFFNCNATMIASTDKRLSVILKQGISPLDRRPFSQLIYDEQKYLNDSHYRDTYLTMEKIFLDTVETNTNGEKVSIFIDNIGTPVFRATLKALARQGVVASSGWKCGMKLHTIRSLECINRHIHVHTHYAKYSEGVEAVKFAYKNNWLPPQSEYVYQWDDIPKLADEFEQQSIEDYFPIYQVNPL